MLFECARVVLTMLCALIAPMVVVDMELYMEYELDFLDQVPDLEEFAEEVLYLLK
jgi:hypothetical protein